MRTRWLAALVLGTSALAAQEKPSIPVLVRNATVWTQGPEGILEDADVLVRNGKVEKVGKGIQAPDDAILIDGTGKHVTPGLIDCHSHIAIRGGVNEGSNNVTAEVRVRDVIDPTDVDIRRELAGGLTVAHLLHGSANSIGGQDAVVKLRWGATAEQMLIPEARPGIKLALGENPKRANFRTPGRPERYPTTRMGVMASIRERLLAAADYQRVWDEYKKLSKEEQARRDPPRRDLQLETLAEILRGDRVIHSHCYRQDEILALIRVADELGIKIATFQHVLEGYKVADEIAAHGAGGSTFSDWWAFKLEAFDATPYNGALMRERGVVVSFNSDSAELARRLNLEAAKAVKYGDVPRADALAFVTLNAAKQLGIDKRVGSLEAGKDGDFVVWSGDPLSTYTVAEQTWVEGVKRFDRAEDRAAREAEEKERADRIERIKRGDSAAKPPAPAPAPPPSPAAKPSATTPVPYADRLAKLGETVSIVHATVHTVTGAVIVDGTVSFREGRIVEVGAGLAPLAGAKVVDATGKHVYPGMIDADTGVGLVEINSVAGSVDLRETGDVHPEVDTAIAINPDSELIPVTRANGLTHVLSVPEGGLISGTSSLIRLDGWTWEDLAAVRSVALHVRWPSFRIRPQGSGRDVPSEADQKKERDESIAKITRAFDDARAYARARGAVGKGGKPVDADPRLQAMLRAIDGKVPVVVHAEEIRQIKSAVAWASEQGLRIVLDGAGDAWRAADLLKEKGIPVIVHGVLRLPSREDEPYDEAYGLPAKLHAAGVAFCIAGDGGGSDSWNSRNLPYQAAMAASYGLPKDVALRAITIDAARILGVDRDLGSIEAGKSASLIVTDGDPLEIRTHVLQAWIDGRPVDLHANRHERLYEKYKKRPLPAKL